MDPIERYLGCLVGLAVGDAMGTVLEFKARGAFEPVTGMLGGGPFHLQPGEWTDDTSIALCLAESLMEKQGFDACDQMERYVRWYREGHYSVKPYCFDIGNTVREALTRFEKSGEPFSGSTNPYTAGNGSIMRLAPVPMAFASKPQDAIRMSAESSRTTHAAQEALDACRYMGGLIAGALNGEDKETFLSEGYAPVKGLWEREPLAEKIRDIAGGSFKRKSEVEIHASGYVVHTLEAALWAFSGSDNFQDGCLKAINLGDDADTTGAVYGQIAGAYYGITGIPTTWLQRLAQRELIEDFARRLFTLSNSMIS